MEGKSGATPSIIDELHSSDIKGDQMEGEGDVIWSMIDQLHSSDIKRDQIEGGSGVTRSTIKFIFRICNEMKWKV